MWYNVVLWVTKKRDMILFVPCLNCCALVVLIVYYVVYYVYLVTIVALHKADLMGVQWLVMGVECFLTIEWTVVTIEYVNWKF